LDKPVLNWMARIRNGIHFFLHSNDIDSITLFYSPMRSRMYVKSDPRQRPQCKRFRRRMFCCPNDPNPVHYPTVRGAEQKPSEQWVRRQKCSNLLPQDSAHQSQPTTILPTKLVHGIILSQFDLVHSSRHASLTTIMIYLPRVPRESWCQYTRRLFPSTPFARPYCRHPEGPECGIPEEDRYCSSIPKDCSGWTEQRFPRPCHYYFW